MKYNLILFSFLLLLNQNVFGQKRDGYIINLNGDTAKGSISYATFFNSKNSNFPGGPVDIRFQTLVEFKDSVGNKVTYRPNEIKGFGYYFNGQVSFFESLLLSDTNKHGIPESGQYFVNRMETGNINIYRYCMTDVACNNMRSPSEYVYLIKKQETNEIKYLSGACDSFPDYRQIINYLGIEHLVSKYIIDENSSGNKINLQQLCIRIHQYNTGDVEIANTIKKTATYCDTCFCNVYLVKNKKKNFVERKWMGTYAPEGFYLYEGFMYNLKFKDEKLFRGVLVKVMGDTMIVTNNLDKSVADKDNKSYDTLSLPISSLEKIHVAANLAGALGKNINMSECTIEAKNVKGSPVAEFSVFRSGKLRDVRSYFVDGTISFVYEHDGTIFWLE